METAVLITGNSWDGSVLPGDLVLERDQLFACTLSFGLEGKVLQEGQPPHCATCCSWCPTSAWEVGKDSSCQQQFQATALSLALLSYPAMHHKGWNRRVCPVQTKGFSSHGHLPTIMAWPRGRRKQVALPIRCFLMQPLCYQEGRQKQCPEDSIGRVEPLEKSGTQISPNNSFLRMFVWAWSSGARTAFDTDSLQRKSVLQSHWLPKWSRHDPFTLSEKLPFPGPTIVSFTELFKSYCAFWSITEKKYAVQNLIKQL